MRDDGPDTARSNHPSYLVSGLILVAILVGLASAPLVDSIFHDHDHRRGRTLDSLKELTKAIQFFHLDRDRYPEDLQELTISTPDSPHGYMREIPPDRWKGTIYYRVTGAGFLLGSPGPDGKEGTEDDIVLETP